MHFVNGFDNKSRSPHCDLCGQGPGKEIPSDPTSPDRPILDLDLYIDHEGAVRICLTCATQIGTEAGLISQEKAEAYEADATENADRIADYAVQISELQGALEALGKVRFTADPPAKKAPAKKAAPVKKAAERAA